MIDKHVLIEALKRIDNSPRPWPGFLGGGTVYDMADTLMDEITKIETRIAEAEARRNDVSPE